MGTQNMGNIEVKSKDKKNGLPLILRKVTVGELVKVQPSIPFPLVPNTALISLSSFPPVPFLLPSFPFLSCSHPFLYCAVSTVLGH